MSEHLIECILSCHNELVETSTFFAICSARSRVHDLVIESIGRLDIVSQRVLGLAGNLPLVLEAPELEAELHAQGQLILDLMGDLLFRAIADADMVLVLLSLCRSDALPVAHHSSTLDDLEAGDLAKGALL